MNLFQAKRAIHRRLPDPIAHKVEHLRDTRSLRHASVRDVAALHLKAEERLALEELDSQPISDEWPPRQQAIDGLRIPADSGGVNPGDQRALYELVRLERSRAILEIGTHVGASTLAFALALNRNQAELGSAAGLTTVDIQDVNSQPWPEQGSGLPRTPSECIALLGLTSHVTFVTEDSRRFLRRSREAYDLVFLDGSHRAGIIYEEIALASELFSQDGLMLMHDYFPEGLPLWPPDRPIGGPYLAVQRVLSENPGLRVVPLGDLPWGTKRGSRTTSLAALARIHE